MSSENDRQESRGGGAARGPEQLALIRETVRKAREPRAKPRTWRGAALAEGLPVARVLVDKGLLHLDQYFDYAVPAAHGRRRAARRAGAGAVRRPGASRAAAARAASCIDGFIVERLRRERLPRARWPRSPRCCRPSRC